MLLIIFAEKQESESFLSHVEIIEETIFENEYSDYQNVLLCKKNNLFFYVAHCGVGKVNSSMFLSFILADSKFKINKIINIGSAGGLGNTKIGEAYLIKNSYYYDVDLTALSNYTLGQLPNNLRVFKTNQKLNSKLELILGLKSINNTSSDRFSTQRDVELIKNNFEQVFCIDMEATSLIHTANFYNVPISILKVISDNIEIKNNNNDYRKNRLLVNIKISEILFEILKGTN